MPTRQRVSAAELVRNFGYWQEKALKAPVFVTHHKRDRLVLTSIEGFLSAAKSDSDEGLLKPPQTEEKTSDIQSEYALLVDNISDAYIVLDHDLVIVAANARLEAMWRVNRDQIIGRSFQDFIPEAKAAILMEKIRRCLISRQADRLEFASAVFPGVHLSTKIYPDPRGVVLLHTNISEVRHLRAELAIAESIRGAVDRHPKAAHAQFDIRGKFTYSDETTRLWTGFDNETLLNTRITDILVQADRKRTLEAFDDVVTNHLPTALQVRVLGKNFKEYETVASLSPIMSEHNAVGVTAIATIVEPSALGEAQ